MNSSKLQDDLSEIRTIMERSTKFLSLSPWSAIMAGVYALTGAAIAFYMINSSAAQEKEVLERYGVIQILFLAGGVFFAAAITAIAANYKKAKKAGQSLWNAPARRAFINFSIPMAAGGIFALTLLFYEHYGLIAPSTLIFYGLALINTGNFTLGDIRTLGIWQLSLGLVAAMLPAYSLLFWALGFGILHLVYGAVLYWKYER